jgi:hypothetical protein
VAAADHHGRRAGSTRVAGPPACVGATRTVGDLRRRSARGDDDETSGLFSEARPGASGARRNGSEGPGEGPCRPSTIDEDTGDRGPSMLLPARGPWHGSRPRTGSWRATLVPSGTRGVRPGPRPGKCIAGATRPRGADPPICVRRIGYIAGRWSGRGTPCAPAPRTLPGRPGEIEPAKAGAGVRRKPAPVLGARWPLRCARRCPRPVSLARSGGLEAPARAMARRLGDAATAAGYTTGRHPTALVRRTDRPRCCDDIPIDGRDRLPYRPPTDDAGDDRSAPSRHPVQLVEPIPAVSVPTGVQACRSGVF